MKPAFFQAVKLLFALLGFVGIMVGYRGSDYPVQGGPSPRFRPTPILRLTPSPKPFSPRWADPTSAARWGSEALPSP